MDDSNFNNYRHGLDHTYYGGFYNNLPAHIVVPHSGYWNVTLDLGGGQANIRYNISFLKARAA